MAQKPSDAHLLAAFMAIGSPYFTAPVREIMDRRGVDPLLGPELDAAVADFVAGSAAAREANDAAAEIMGWRPGAIALRAPGPSAADFAIHIRFESARAPRRFCAWLASCGVAFQSGDLAKLATNRSAAPADSLWAIEQLAAGAHAGAPMPAQDIAAAADWFCAEAFGWVEAQGAPLAREALLSLHGLGLLSDARKSSLMAAHVRYGHLELAELLASLGGRWSNAHDAIPDAAFCFAQGLRGAQAQPAFISRAARLGVGEGFDHALDKALAEGRAWNFLSPYNALGPAPAGAASGFDRALAAQLSEAGFHIDAGAGFALMAAARQRLDAPSAPPSARHEPFERLLRIGADPSACGADLFMAPVSWFGRQAVASDMAASIPAWIARLAQLGIHPKDIAKDSPADRNAVASCIAQGQPLALAHALLDAGAPPDWRDPPTGETLAALLAKRSGPAPRTLLAKILASPSARSLIDTPATGADAGTALMRACFSLDCATAKILIDHGANPNAADARGMTALHHAARKTGAKAQEKALPMVEMLLAAGADAGRTDAKGRTPAQAMAAKSPLPALASLLARRPQDVAGDELEAKSAQAKILLRGSGAVAAVEKAILSAEPASSAPPKANARRI